MASRLLGKAEDKTSAYSSNWRPIALMNLSGILFIAISLILPRPAYLRWRWFKRFQRRGFPVQETGRLSFNLRTTLISRKFVHPISSFILPPSSFARFPL